MRASALGALLLVGCASPGLLSSSEVRDLSTRRWDGATDEVFDATWLSLTARGFAVTKASRPAGTLEVVRDGRAWEVDVAALGSEQRVVLEPATGVSRAELGQVLDGVEEGTAALLAAWKDQPEWRYDGRRNVLSAAGFSFVPPREWEWLDFDVSHHLVTVQQRRARTGLNPTLLVEVDRLRPESSLPQLARRALGLALGARQRLVFPDGFKEGPVQVLDGATPQDAEWFAFEETVGAAQVRVTLACPRGEEGACRAWWNAVRGSVVMAPKR